MKEIIEIYTDGASRGNPGLAAIGVVLKKDGKIIQEISKTIGQTTNNVAEYTALIYGLQEALILKYQSIKIYTDSELMYNQLKGIYKVKNPNLKPLYDQIQHLFKGFKDMDINHVPREQNKDADRLANIAFKKEQTKVVAPASQKELELDF